MSEPDTESTAQSTAIPAAASQRTDAGVAAALAQHLCEIHFICGVPHYTRPGQEPRPLAHLVPIPQRVRQTLECQSLASFSKYIEAHTPESDASPAIFADRGSAAPDVPKLTVIFDYHEDADCPKWGEDRARFCFETDPRFDAWNKTLGQWISQADLVDLLETQEASLIAPTPAQMLEMASQLEIHQKSKVVSRRNTTNGTGEIRFETSEGESAGTRIPDRFTIGVPLWRGITGEGGKPRAWKLEMRLRYRLLEGLVYFQLVCPDLCDVLDEAWAEVVDLVRAWALAPAYEAQAPRQSGV